MSESKHVFTVGERVSFDDGDNVVGGEIKSFHTEVKYGQSVDFANVLMDDTSTEEDFELSQLAVEGENATLEVEFKALAEAHMQEINKQLEIASKAIAAAESLSEAYGLPFSSNVSPLGQGYTPASYYKKFAKLGRGFVSNLTGSYPGGEYSSSGWEHSAVC